MKNSSLNTRQLIRHGIASGFPIFIGYFPAAMAFGLIARDIALSLPESMLFSMVLFAGASQFFALNLIASGAAAVEVVIGVVLVNLRHLLMSASISRRTTASSPLTKMLVAFGNTDEVFATASSSSGSIDTAYLVAMEITAWSGWVLGTLTGFSAGSILPDSLQQCIGITLYGMFAAILAQTLKQIPWYIIVAAVAAGVNSLLVAVTPIQAGWAFAISMVTASLLGAWILPGISSAFAGLETE